MADTTTTITPPRVPIIDERTGLISREWYRFFLNLFTVTGGGVGITPIANGGTNSAAVPQAGAVAYGNGTSYRFTTVGTPGQVLVSNGAGAPGWTTVSGSGTVTSVDVSGGTTGLTYSGGPVTTSGTITLGGTLSVSNGGTGLTSLIAGDLPYYTAGSSLSALPIGAANSVLTSDGVSPQWSSSITVATANLGDWTFSGSTASTTAGITFQTTPLIGGAPITALTIDQYRCVTGNSTTVSDGLSGSYSTAIQAIYPFLVYNDDQSAASQNNAIILGNAYLGGQVTATNTSVTYDKSVSFYVAGTFQGGTNVTISQQLAFLSDVGDSEFSGVFYIGAGTNPTSFAGARCCVGPLGYGQNSAGLSPGGAVTQATNKSTAVTLDNPCGVITMNNAALAAGASVSFILNNTYIATTDTLIVNMGPAGTADTYSCVAQITGAGTARIRVTNYSATSRSEACKVNFAIITATNV